MEAPNRTFIGSVADIESDAVIAASSITLEQNTDEDS
jgi:hypothetical protein